MGAVRITAVIGHADTPEMLRHCAMHHLNLGVNSIFVSLNGSDEESRDVVEDLSRIGRVRGANVKEFAESEYHFLTDAVRQARQHFNPDFVLIMDSDEFWCCRNGPISAAKNIEQCGVLSVARYNTPIVLQPNLKSSSFGAIDLETRVVPRLSQAQAAAFTSRRTALSWLHTRINPKIMARADLISEVHRGGHTVETTTPGISVTEPEDLAIVHLPFSTLKRFERKITGMRARIRSFDPQQAGHWRAWIAAADEGRTEELFRNNTISPLEALEYRVLGLLLPVRQVLEPKSSVT